MRVCVTCTHENLDTEILEYFQNFGFPVNEKEKNTVRLRSILFLNLPVYINMWYFIFRSRYRLYSSNNFHMPQKHHVLM